MITAALALACFAAGWAVCNRLKDRRAERAEARVRQLLSNLPPPPAR